LLNFCVLIILCLWCCFCILVDFCSFLAVIFLRVVFLFCKIGFSLCLLPFVS